MHAAVYILHDAALAVLQLLLCSLCCVASAVHTAHDDVDQQAYF